MNKQKRYSRAGHPGPLSWTSPRLAKCGKRGERLTWVSPTRFSLDEGVQLSAELRLSQIHQTEDLIAETRLIELGNDESIRLLLLQSLRYFPARATRKYQRNRCGSQEWGGRVLLQGSYTGELCFQGALTAETTTCPRVVRMNNLRRRSLEALHGCWPMWDSLGPR